MRTGTLSLGAVCRAVLKLKEAEKQKKSPMLACSEPSYEQRYLAYCRCFDERNGVYYVGNHRLCELFVLVRAVPILASNVEIINIYRQISASSNKPGLHYFYIFRAGAMVLLNKDIPTEKLEQTIKNFASELEREYQRHLKDVLAEAEP